MMSTKQNTCQRLISSITCTSWNFWTAYKHHWYFSLPPLVFQHPPLLFKSPGCSASKLRCWGSSTKACKCGPRSNVITEIRCQSRLKHTWIGDQAQIMAPWDFISSSNEPFSTHHTHGSSSTLGLQESFILHVLSWTTYTRTRKKRFPLVVFRCSWIFNSGRWWVTCWRALAWLSYIIPKKCFGVIKTVSPC